MSPSDLNLVYYHLQLVFCPKTRVCAPSATRISLYRHPKHQAQITVLNHFTTANSSHDVSVLPKSGSKDASRPPRLGIALHHLSSRQRPRSMLARLAQAIPRSLRDDLQSMERACPQNSLGTPRLSPPTHASIPHRRVFQW